jgi:hypothetical protein
LTRDQARNRTKCQMEKKSHKNISIVEIFNWTDFKWIGWIF